MRAYLKASAFHYALILSLIIAIVCASLLAVFSLSESRIKTLEKRADHKRAILSAFNYVKGNYSSLSYFKNYDLSEFVNKCSIELEPWGLFDILKIRLDSSNVTGCLLASAVNSKDKFAIKLKDQGFPLILTGKTLIKGNVYAPDNIVKRGYVEGKNFAFQELVRGDIFKSSEKLDFVGKNKLANIHSKLLKGVDLKKEKIENSFLSDKVLEVNSSKINNKGNRR